MAREEGPHGRLSDLASAQHGRVSRRQLTEIGFSEKEIRGMVAKHRLTRVHHGVYAVGHLGELPLSRQFAALLAVVARAL